MPNLELYEKKVLSDGELSEQQAASAAQGEGRRA